MSVGFLYAVPVARETPAQKQARLQRQRAPRRRRIRDLARGKSDPCTDAGPVHRLIRRYLSGLLSFDEFDLLGGVFAIAWLAPVWAPPVFLGWYLAGGWGVFLGFLFACGLFVGYVVWGILWRRKIKRLVRETDGQLCLWCRHDLRGMPHRGRCGECGLGYDLPANVAIFHRRLGTRKVIPRGHGSGKKKIIWGWRRWARALREYERYPRASKPARA